jgi:hypothetical protein
MDQLPLENFESSRIELLVCQKSLIGLSKISYCLFCQKLASCGENGWLWEKGGVFEIFDQFLFEQLSLCLNKCVWLRDRKLSLICKNKTKWWQRMIQICQIWVFICIDVALLLVAFYYVGINHQKGGRLKGKCALGPFLSILVIKCPTQVLKC